jgi:hypothetical protein
MAEVCAFFDEVEDDGWAKVTRMHHQPAKLDEETRARGVVVTPPRPPKVRRGWTVGLWVEPRTGAAEYRVEMDEDYRMSAADFLLLVPVQARIMARQAAAEGDLVMQDFLDMLDRMIADNASMGLHPGGEAAKVALGYLVSKEWMTAEQASAITDP